jgi:glycyl-tRNA synthetase
MITLQQLIHRLTLFWEKKGCIIHQGHDLEVGAGTFNPATFLRCLGPEPYATAYVEPSRRPADARYGQNPNRIQLFHQFQVIIKPAPIDIQADYLKSLEAIGFKLKDHDIRFVHDDWESPTLGAWGLGWEVWCDGMEVSQFTYFQGMASLPLKPVSAEITYGLERLCMFIQNVDNMFDIKWNDTLTLGDISKRSEVEWSTYNFEESSAEMWHRHFEDFEKEAKRLALLHLPIPAYDFVIKASHAFNMLDARGVISTTERTGYIGRIRDLARLIAMEYIASREKQGFPLLGKPAPAKPHKLKKVPAKFKAADKQDFLFEIGSEQLPATFVPIGLRNLEKAVRALLEGHELNFEKIECFGTPRRLAVLVKKLSAGTAAKTIEKRGPAVSSAFDAQENWTAQGQGFLKSLGIPQSTLSSIRAGKPKDISIRTIKETEYLFVTVKEKSKSTVQLLAEALPKIIADLEFPKKMRWDSLDASYARPIHWIVALFGDAVIPFAYADVLSNRHTFGHAQRDPAKISLKNPNAYLFSLKAHSVLADIEERKQSILTQLDKIKDTVKGEIVEQNKVLSQVLHLTEWPELTHATFDPVYLKAPAEVLISEMVEHQKYFPVASSDKKLKNIFIITADNTPNDLIQKGNQKVLSARLADGVFLYESDSKIPLEKFNEKLKEVTFQKDLGSVLDKVMRLISHVKVVNDALEIADQKKIERAALLSKADLASSCVKEFPELQGTIGKYYALAQKEDPEVAAALEEQWLPKSEGGPLPRTAVGVILSLADKVDNLLGYYHVGLKPTSSSDPYSLRRQTIGLIKIVLDGKHSIDLKKIFETCSKKFPHFKHELIEEILRFITARAKGVFEEQGFKKDEVEASLHSLCINPYDQFCKVQALHEFRKTPHFNKLFEVYKRAKGQLETKLTAIFNPALALEPAEKALVRALEHVHKSWHEVMNSRDYAKAYSLIAELQPHLAHLFDTVKILAEDPALRDNRLALLQKVFTYFQELLDFGQIQQL